MTFGTLSRRSNPWSDLLALQKEMDRMFEAPMANASGRGAMRSDSLFPVDVLRSADNIIVRADIPGVTKDDLEITMLKNRLFIRGEKKNSAEASEGSAHRLERFYGRFERAIDLPDSVSQEQIKATFTDGTLEITAPISEDAKPRRIAVEVK